MNAQNFFIIISLAAIIVSCAIAEGNGKMEDFVILPEPSIGAIRGGDYSVDVEAMKSHYNNLFSGRSAQEVMQTLQNENIGHRFDSSRKILFFPRHVFPALLTSYSCVVEISFEDGMFFETTDVKLCGIDAL